MAHARTIIDLLRHGEPEGGRMYRGQKDDPLSPLGWEQMRAATAGEEVWGRVVSSPLRRCREFAETLSAERGLALRVEEGFREVSFGPWEGRRPDDLHAEQPESVEAFWQDPVGRWPAGGEVFTDFQARVATAWDNLLGEHRGESLLLVAHGGVIRAILFHVLGIPPRHFFRIQVPYAGLTRLRTDGRGGHPYLVFHRPPPVVA